jgi:hypothetical protein
MRYRESALGARSAEPRSGRLHLLRPSLACRRGRANHLNGSTGLSSGVFARRSRGAAVHRDGPLLSREALALARRSPNDRRRSKRVDSLNSRTALVWLLGDLVVAILAIALPKQFVTYSNYALELIIGEGRTNLAFSYGILLFGLAVGFSIIRAQVLNSTDPPQWDWRHLLILSATAIFVWKYGFRDSASPPVEAITQQTIPYVLSVLVCLGAGYAAADTIMRLLWRR